LDSRRGIGRQQFTISRLLRGKAVWSPIGLTKWTCSDELLDMSIESSKAPKAVTCRPSSQPFSGW
jgi:hypothetical protein